MKMNSAARKTFLAERSFVVDPAGIGKTAKHVLLHFGDMLVGTKFCWQRTVLRYDDLKTAFQLLQWPEDMIPNKELLVFPELLLMCEILFGRVPVSFKCDNLSRKIREEQPVILSFELEVSSTGIMTPTVTLFFRISRAADNTRYVSGYITINMTP